MPKGFLAVLSEPGQVPIDEFHDWYNNEHIPLRLDHLPAFLTGARYTARDGKKPSWIALYDIDSVSTFADPSYTRLRENRSPREAALVKRLDVLDRRTCEVISESENKRSVTEALSTGLALGNPAQWIFTHGVDTNTEEGGDAKKTIAEAWRTMAEIGRRVTGLHRSRLFECTDSLKTGVTISTAPEEQKVARYLVLHELTSKDAFGNLRAGLQELADNNRLTISEEREWSIYRAYPCIAQGNVNSS
ncbi:hypothetical protein P691DRAFT_774388 [Macrolepiota fuliginosa MF-IS2]|uniref:EthD domain-containing protein n=1 Tax=Macrolepiota fuliginosa MF-IS2 TaxID=1400762 RepID=A0A9P6C5J0_9AGAR|nr:hypothetical protein P691DRAFT_774388 [Macrolepiota fuliginosa MF-IS2]